jgi:hypothetical protein
MFSCFQGLAVFEGYRGKKKKKKKKKKKNPPKIKIYQIKYLF